MGGGSGAETICLLTHCLSNFTKQINSHSRKMDVDQSQPRDVVIHLIRLRTVLPRSQHKSEQSKNIFKGF